MKVIVLLISLLLICKSYSENEYGQIIKKFKIDNKDFILIQEATYQELWEIDPKINQKRSIKRMFSFEGFAKKCIMIDDSPIFFSTIKEYFFAGGWKEPSYLTVFNLKGIKLGISPNLNYAENLCDFYE